MEPIIAFLTPDRLIICGIFLSIMFWRHYKFRSQVSELTRTREFLLVVNSKFIEYINSHAKDETLYEWLLEHSYQLDRHMGYPDVSNAISFAKEYMENGIPINVGPNAQITFVKETLIKEAGRIQHQIKEIKKRINNPLYLLQASLQDLSALPLSLLGWLRILSPERVLKAHKSNIFTILNRLTLLVGIIASVMTIILGWDEAVSILTGWWL